MINEEVAARLKGRLEKLKELPDRGFVGHREIRGALPTAGGNTSSPKTESRACDRLPAVNSHRINR
ncbi:MAG: hypothetical protein GY866_41325 [Proteobacteria bacterium]|nr:hypothetical protein [Pseudomonadota bacterium]